MFLCSCLVALEIVCLVKGHCLEDAVVGACVDRVGTIAAATGVGWLEVVGASGAVVGASGAATGGGWLSEGAATRGWLAAPSVGRGWLDEKH